jgi:hypothetical protein
MEEKIISRTITIRSRRDSIRVRTLLRRIGLSQDFDAIFPIDENELRLVNYAEIRNIVRERGKFNGNDNKRFSASFSHTIPCGKYEMTRYSKGYKLTRLDPAA